MTTETKNFTASELLCVMSARLLEDGQVGRALRDASQASQLLRVEAGDTEGAELLASIQLLLARIHATLRQPRHALVWLGKALDTSPTPEFVMEQTKGSPHLRDLLAEPNANARQSR